MQDNLFNEGLQLMVYGMGTVILFLSLLVAATTAMSALIARYFPAVTVAASPSPTTGRKPAPEDDSELVAVIGAALQQHRRRQRR